MNLPALIHGSKRRLKRKKKRKRKTKSTSRKRNQSIRKKIDKLLMIIDIFFVIQLLNMIIVSKLFFSNLSHVLENSIKYFNGRNLHQIIKLIVQKLDF